MAEFEADPSQLDGGADIVFVLPSAMLCEQVPVVPGNASADPSIPISDPDGDRRWLLTRAPVGAKLLGSTGDGRLLLPAAGSVHAATPEAVTVLARVHAAFPISLDEAATDVEPKTAEMAVADLVVAGLITRVPNLL
ncbi:hypothetical protein ACFY00_24945 [Kitasatospora sp. NPDC001540]|uniref:hypothetical protein n=1 Tax=Kitasatospora sp. NPDC001540 TaxID=3364014 RepID=UPI00369C3DAF